MDKKQSTAMPKSPGILFSGFDENGDELNADPCPSTSTKVTMKVTTFAPAPSTPPPCSPALRNEATPSSSPSSSSSPPPSPPPQHTSPHEACSTYSLPSQSPWSLGEADYAQRHISMMATLKDSQIIRSGYLLKRRRTRKSWKKRWFVLRSSHISIYESDKEYTIKHLLLLSDVQAVSKTRLRHHPFAWALFTKPRTWYFEAETEEEAMAWIADIKHLLTETPSSSALATNDKLPLLPNPRSKGQQPVSVSCSSSASSSRSSCAATSGAAAATSPSLETHQHPDMLSPTYSELACSSPDFSSDAASPKSNDSLQLDKSPKLSSAKALGLDVGPSQDVENVSAHASHSHHYSHLFRRRKHKKKLDVLDYESQLLENVRLEDAKLVMQGYLEKYHGPYRKWSRHWFVLRDFNLACYENEKEYVLLRLIRLQKVITIQAWESIGKHHPYTIKIETSKKSFILSADSLKEFHGWLNALREQHVKIFSR